jgi:hypothetical protein
LVGELGGEKLVLQALNGIALKDEFPGWRFAFRHCLLLRWRPKS